jgi:hypothetical protein
MAAPNVNEPPAGTKSPWWKTLLLKAAILIGLGLLLGAAYDWAATRMYGPERVPGFRLGVLHGALMPVALPTLLMGRDVPIYAATNTGRIYKIGYIAGINLCGMTFFGAAFRRPRKR